MSEPTNRARPPDSAERSGHRLMETAQSKNRQTKSLTYVDMHKKMPRQRSTPPRSKKARCLQRLAHSASTTAEHSGGLRQTLYVRNVAMRRTAVVPLRAFPQTRTMLCGFVFTCKHSSLFPLASFACTWIVAAANFSGMLADSFADTPTFCVPFASGRLRPSQLRLPMPSGSSNVDFSPSLPENV